MISEIKDTLQIEKLLDTKKRAVVPPQTANMPVHPPELRIDYIKSRKWDCVPTLEELGYLDFSRRIFNSIIHSGIDEFFLLYTYSNDPKNLGFIVDRKVSANEFYEFCSIYYSSGFLLTNLSEDFLILCDDDESIIAGPPEFIKSVLGHSIEEEIEIFKSDDLFKNQSETSETLLNRREYFYSLLDRFVVRCSEEN